MIPVLESAGILFNRQLYFKASSLGQSRVSGVTHFSVRSHMHIREAHTYVSCFRHISLNNLIILSDDFLNTVIIMTAK